MSLHFEPVLYLVRGYQDGEDPYRQYTERRPYRLVFSVFMQGDVARIFGGHGSITPDTIKEACRHLAAHGVHTVIMERHGTEHIYFVDPAGNARPRDATMGGHHPDGAHGTDHPIPAQG